MLLEFQYDYYDSDRSDGDNDISLNFRLRLLPLAVFRCVLGRAARAKLRIVTKLAPWGYGLLHHAEVRNVEKSNSYFRSPWQATPILNPD